MATKKINYLIGNAELLTKPVLPKNRFIKKENLYTVDEIQERLLPAVESMVSDADWLDSTLCPKNYVVGAITLHPSYIAKSFFPNKLLREIGGRSIGSKNIKMIPDKWKKKARPNETTTTLLYVALQKPQLHHLEKIIKDLSNDNPLFDDLEKIWNIEFVEPLDKIKDNPERKQNYYEIGLHLLPSTNSEFIKQSFLRLAEKLSIEVKTDLGIDVSNLWFVPCIGIEENITEIAKFMFVRVIRPIPTIRAFYPLMKANNTSSNVFYKKQRPLDPELKVAILDGGLPEAHVLEPWVKNYRETNPSALEYPGGLEHGLGVTSAFLFGPLNEGEITVKPYSYVDHYRILDETVNNEDPIELYSMLKNIEDILITRQYQFINLSVGPYLPIDDDEVHPWTALIDSYLADGETLITVAAGNNGESDLESGLNRILVPSDSVNALCVGACSTTDSNWKRTSYSACGPGRSPGRVKPDLLAFGGSTKEYFHVPDPYTASKIIPQRGTSFAAPYLLRTAVGMKAILGDQISILAIKALLIHNAHNNSEPKEHVGWGKIPEDINDIIVSQDGVVKILYQGELYPGKYLNVPLPVPSNGIQGKVTIKATCCIACDTDPQESAMYSKAGITIKWLPKINEDSESFFMQTKFANEAELKADAGKWETVLHNEKTKFGSSLIDPSFELHYSARDGGANAKIAIAQPVKYALVVTIKAPKSLDIFNEIMSEYSNILTEIEPQINIPIQIN